MSLDAGFCVSGLERALAQGTPEIFNTDQGSQFTSEAFTGTLIDAEVAISMDGRGRAHDNIFVERLWRTVSLEDIYLRDYGNVSEVRTGLDAYFRFYNHERGLPCNDRKRQPDIARKELRFRVFRIWVRGFSASNLKSRCLRQLRRGKDVEKGGRRGRNGRERPQVPRRRQTAV